MKIQYRLRSFGNSSTCTLESFADSKYLGIVSLSGGIGMPLLAGELMAWAHTVTRPDHEVKVDHWLGGPHFRATSEIYSEVAEERSIDTSPGRDISSLIEEMFDMFNSDTALISRLNEAVR